MKIESSRDFLSSLSSSRSAGTSKVRSTMTLLCFGCYKSILNKQASKNVEERAQSRAEAAIERERRR